MSRPQEILDGVIDDLGTIADELQQGQMIEEDDALGRRLVGLQARIEQALGLMSH